MFLPQTRSVACRLPRSGSRARRPPRQISVVEMLFFLAFRMRGWRTLVLLLQIKNVLFHSKTLVYPPVHLTHVQWMIVLELCLILFKSQRKMFRLQGKGFATCQQSRLDTGCGRAVQERQNSTCEAGWWLACTVVLRRRTNRGKKQCWS